MEPSMAHEQDPATVEIVAALRTVLSEAAEPNAVLAAILKQAVERTGADRGLLAEVLEDGEPEYRLMHGFKSEQFEGDAGAFSRHLFGSVIQSGREVLLERAADHPYFSTIPSVRSLKTAAILCMPIPAGGRIAALVHLENRRPGHFRAEHRDLLRSLLTVAGRALEALSAGRDVLRERDRLQSEAEESRALLAEEWDFGRFVGRSEAIRELEISVRRAAAMAEPFPILLLGEAGTGKSILARVLHSAGNRRQRPMVTVSCPSLQRDMVEAELFGHRKGAFTGALTDRIGKVPAAEGGTLFLDKIGELPLEMQPKLLRLLEEKRYERVGDHREQTADVRIIAATNLDLGHEVERGRFRRDLFDRINFLPIRVPPLRERVEDIPLLLRYCLDRTESGRWIELTQDATSCLLERDSMWPGNVRTIQQLAAGLAAEGGRGPASARDIARLLDERERPGAKGDPPSPAAEENPDEGLWAHMNRMERDFILDATRRNPRATRAELAAGLGISEAALFVKLRKHGIGK
jgi:transcriptional regulator with GAF, ATPase, and Fis domain